MKLIFTFTLFTVVSAYAQTLYKINDTFSVAVGKSQKLYDGTVVQNVRYDSTDKTLYVEDACAVYLKWYPAEYQNISYKIVDSANQANFYGSVLNYDPAPNAPAYTYSFQRPISSVGYVSHNGIPLIKVKLKYIRTIFPHIADANQQIVKGKISTDFLTNNHLTVLTTTSSQATPFSCGHNYYGAFILIRDGIKTTVYEDTLNASFILQEGDKLVGTIDPKACGLLNGGYECINYNKDTQTDTLYVRNVVTGIVEDVASQAFTFAPNPTENELHFSKIAEEVKIYDLMGTRLLEQQATDHINLGQLPVGCYVMDVRINGKVIQKRVFVK